MYDKHKIDSVGGLSLLGKFLKLELERKYEEIVEVSDRLLSRLPYSFAMLFIVFTSSLVPYSCIESVAW